MSTSIIQPPVLLVQKKVPLLSCTTNLSIRPGFSSKLAVELTLTLILYPVLTLFEVFEAEKWDPTFCLAVVGLGSSLHYRLIRYLLPVLSYQQILWDELHDKLWRPVFSFAEEKNINRIINRKYMKEIHCQCSCWWWSKVLRFFNSTKSFNAVMNCVATIKF